MQSTPGLFQSAAANAIVYIHLGCQHSCEEIIGDTPTLNLKALSQKLVVLLALSNAPRASDLVALDVRFVQSSEEGVTFRIPGLTKTRRSGPPRSFEVSRFEDASLCPVKTLEYYLRQTKDIRKDGGNGSYPLFISVRKPHNAVTLATIGRWIKQILSMAGVNTDQLSAHSTRSASTTAAKKQGVSVRDIMGTVVSLPLRLSITHKPAVSNYSEAVLGGKKGTCSTYTIALNNTLSYIRSLVT